MIMEVNKKDLQEIRFDNAQGLFNLGNWVDVLDMVLPDDFEIKSKLGNNVKKEKLITNLRFTVNRLKKNNEKLMIITGDRYINGEKPKI